MSIPSIKTGSGIQKGPVLVVFIILFTKTLFSQELNYKDIFGKDWVKAESFIAENESWMRNLSEKYEISYPVATAIVFPELIRYSALMDKIEITLLKTLYINLGDEYADFSIGPFQMKPSFGELIREQAPFLKDKIKFQLKPNPEKGDITKYRALIVKDLEHVESQFIYLIGFIKIGIIKYRLEDSDEVSRVKFLATAYNCGLKKTFEQITEMSEKKFFNTKLSKTENYSYSDISLHWYFSFLGRGEMLNGKAK